MVSPDELELLEEELLEEELLEEELLEEELLEEELEDEELEEELLLELVVLVSGLDLLPLPQPVKPSRHMSVKSVSILGTITISNLPY